MSDVTEDLVTGGDDGVDPRARITALTQRVRANPEKIGLRLRLAHLLEESGRHDEALRTLDETVARFPRNGVARMRLEALRERKAAASVVPQPAVAKAPPAMAAPAAEVPQDAPARAPETEPAPPPTRESAAEHRFAAQDELLHLARAAQGHAASAAPSPADTILQATPSDITPPAGLQAEPSLRLRLNPLAPRYRAEIYIASGLIAVIVLSGLLAWRAPNAGLLIDRGAPTPIVLAPLPPDHQAAAPPPAAPPDMAPPPEALAPVTLKPGRAPDVSAGSVPDDLATPAPRMVEATPPAAPAVASRPALAPLPERTALPDVALDVPGVDGPEAEDVADRLRRAGIAVHPMPRTTARLPAGVSYFYAEDAALARTVASVLGDPAGEVRQAVIPPGGDVLPGAIRVTLPAAPRQPSRQGGNL